MSLVEIPERGIGFYCYGPANQRWVLPQVAAAIAGACAIFWRDFYIDVGIGSASIEGGGRVAPHVSHQGGLDVDIRPVRRDREPLPVDIEAQSNEYDRFLTRTLIFTLQQYRFTKFLFEDDALAGMQGVSKYPGHSNHIHATWGVAI